MTTHPELAPVQQAADKLRERFGAAPPTALVLGSGLGVIVDRMEARDRAAYADLGLPQSTVAGHAGFAMKGTLGGADLLVMSGRVHLYEGLGPQIVVRAVRALAAWGVKNLVLTNSAGGITPGLNPGDLVLVSDHLNLQGVSSLYGPPFGVRFPDMSEAYNPRLRGLLQEAAGATGRPMPEGVYAATLGPSYETPAEVRMARTMGADLVGMSTVPEVLAVHALGVRVVAISVVSNLAAGISATPLTHEEVTVAAGTAAGRLGAILAHAIPRFPTD